jgi:hypothetical protein
LVLTAVFAHGTKIPRINNPRNEPEKKLDKEMATWKKLMHSQKFNI